MKPQSQNNIKTIHLDAHVFQQDQLPLRSKVPAQLLKTLVVRKRRQSNSNKSNTQKANCKQFAETSLFFDQIDIVNRNRVLEVKKPSMDRGFLGCKRHSETRNSCQRNSTMFQKGYSFKRYTHNDQSQHQFKQQEEVQNEEAQSPIKQDQSFQPTDQQIQKDKQINLYEEEAKSRLNPYTKDQYIYMKNRHMDELMQLRRTGKLRRISSITKSYKITTIELAPQHRRTISFHTPAPLKNHQTTYTNKSATRSPIKKQTNIQPSPWQWTAQQQNRLELQ